MEVTTDHSELDFTPLPSPYKFMDVSCSGTRYSAALPSSRLIRRVLVMNLVLVFALALFTGCDAKITQQNQPKPPADMVKDAFWDYVAKATWIAGDSLALIRESDLGKEINTLISGSNDAFNRFAEVLRTQVTQDFTSRFFEQAEQLKIRLEKDLSTTRAHLQPYADEAVTRFQEQVEDLKKEASSYAETMDSEALKAVLLRKSQELKTHLDKNFGKLQTQMIPYTEELKQKVENSLQEFQNNIMPLAQKFQSQLTEKTQEIQEKLVPYGEELRAKVDLDTQNLKEQLVALWESFTKLTR
ncbi:apolipoprotein A-IV a [Syngnathoides biaculeatus]|uniref:apolipoprotein A-IV a n=1 Tax=Syngnathoides biaculeatus TaxID=300417 RepID=UPI002ADD97B8|nr:apolipoprotein A-IV a [Syngnathoides biaculeatus]